MNCYYHPTEPAVARCTRCGKGVCSQCIRYSGEAVVCPACDRTGQTEGLFYYLKYVILYVALFCIGYELDFMSSETVRHSPYESGYILLALVCGWQALNRIMPLRMESGTLVAWGIYALLKVLVSVVAGFFIAPLILLYNIFKLIVEFRKESELFRMGRRRYYRIKPTERSIPNSSIFREVWPRMRLSARPWSISTMRFQLSRWSGR